MSPALPGRTKQQPMTHNPYRGYDVVTVQGLVEELAVGDSIMADYQVKNPDHGTPFKDRALREHLDLERQEWFSFASVLACIERGAVDDDDDEADQVGTTPPTLTRTQKAKELPRELESTPAIA